LCRTLGGYQRYAALEQYETNADMMKLNITLNMNRPKQTEKNRWYRVVVVPVLPLAGQKSSHSWRDVWNNFSLHL
jgi:hypothetical protein